LGYVETWSPQGSILGPLLFLVYINDLPPRINSQAEPILFADVIISNGNFKDLSATSNLVLSCMIEWFAANKLILNLEKTNVMKFVTKNLPYCALTIGYKDKYIEEVVNTKFLGMHLDNHLNCNNHIDQIIPKLSAACYVVRQMYHFVNQNTLKSIYFTYFHSIVKYGIILGGNSPNSRKIFTLQKHIIRIMIGAHPRTSCRRLFKKIRDFNSSKPIYVFINELLCQ
jgi:mannose/fructose/N-acetylgalactosamine-specific phosphotransferase system component IID